MVPSMHDKSSLRKKSSFSEFCIPLYYSLYTFYLLKIKSSKIDFLQYLESHESSKLLSLVCPKEQL